MSCTNTANRSAPAGPLTVNVWPVNLHAATIDGADVLTPSRITLNPRQHTSMGMIVRCFML
jgi:hypothetical protein